MKKTAILITALLMVLLVLVSCGNSSNGETKQTDDKAQKQTSDVTEKTDDKKEPEKIEGAKIENATSFSEGIAFIQVDGKVYAVSTKGEKLFDAPADFAFGLEQYYENGLLVIGDNGYDKEGKLVISPSKFGYDNIHQVFGFPANLEGTVLAVKIEGTAYHYMVINSKGEVVKELSPKGEYTVGKCCFIWDQATDTWGDRLEEYQVFYYSGEGGIFKQDYHGEKNLVLPGITCEKEELFFDSAFIGVKDGKTGLYDYDGKLIADLGTHKISKGAYDGEKVMFVENSTLYVVGKDGKNIIDPIKVSSDDAYCSFEEKGIVYSVKQGESEIFFYNDLKGNNTEYKGVTAFYGFNDGLALVSNGSNQLYFINVSGEIVIK